MENLTIFELWVCVFKRSADYQEFLTKSMSGFPDRVNTIITQASSSWLNFSLKFKPASASNSRLLPSNYRTFNYQLATINYRTFN